MNKNILFLFFLGLVFSVIQISAQRKPKPMVTPSKGTNTVQIPKNLNINKPASANSEVKPINNKTVSPNKNYQPVRPPRTPS